MEGAPHSITAALEARGQTAAQTEFMRRAQQLSRGEERSRSGSFLPHLWIMASVAALGAVIAVSLMRRGK